MKILFEMQKKKNRKSDHTKLASSRIRHRTLFRLLIVLNLLDSSFYFLIIHVVQHPVLPQKHNMLQD